MRFLVTNEARAVGIEAPVIALYQNVRQATEEEIKVYQPTISEVMERVKKSRDSILAKPEVVGFRELFSRLGYPKTVPAGERLLSFVDRGWKSYGNLVDSYNLPAFEDAVGIGVHDARSLADVYIVYKRAVGNETIVPSFKEKRETIKAEDLTYGFYNSEREFVPLAWFGKKDVDNRDFQLQPDTTAFLLTAIGNARTSQEYNIDICKRVYTNLQKTCPEVMMELYPAQFIDNKALAKILEPAQSK